MNIDRTQQTSPVQNSTTLNQDIQAKKTDIPASSARSGQDGSTRVKLSRLAQQLQSDDSQDVNTDRLADIKARMDAGELNLDSDGIASALVRDMIHLS